MTKAPVSVDPELALLCRGVSIQDIAEARKKNGPHAYTTVRVYMNDPAAAAFLATRHEYPVGSVVVKEKSGGWYRSTGSGERGKKLPDGVGGMIKRSPGYDPNNGDWEYFYFETPSRIESGRITSCVNCHKGAAQQDHVFGTWGRPDTGR